jgi:hypothetical protein
MGTENQQDGGTGGGGQPQDKAPDTEAQGADALNDARALQQMIEGTPDSTDEFRRIEQKR